MRAYYHVYTCPHRLESAVLVRCRDEYFETGWYTDPRAALDRAEEMAACLRWELEGEED